MLYSIFIVIGFVLFLILFNKLKQRHFFKWCIGYVVFLWQHFINKPDPDKTIHIMFAFVDHFEPGHGKVTEQKADARVKKWYKNYQIIARKHKDADGHFPKHTWFFPPHYYKKDYLDTLSELTYHGFGEVEFHLHHGNDTSESLDKKIRETQNIYSQHGIFVTTEEKPKLQYAFIHGDWALDNSRETRHCGVNNELVVLKQTGCFVDMTFPSLHEAQPQKINSIYYAKDDPYKPKSYNWGENVKFNGRPSGDLMLIQGPLSINWKDWHHKYYPAFETGEVVKEYPPNKKRVDFWIESHIHVEGKPEWTFIKVHTHGAVDKDSDTLLGKERDDLHTYLENMYNDGKRYMLHYVSAREMYNIVKAAEAGKTGNPNEYRNFIISPYANQKILSKQYYKLISYTESSFKINMIGQPNELKFKDFYLNRVAGVFNSLNYYEKEKEIVFNFEGNSESNIEICLPGKLLNYHNCELINTNSHIYTFTAQFADNGKIIIEFEE